MNELQAARCSVEQAIENTEALDQAIAGQHDAMKIARLLAELQSHLHHALVKLPELHQDQINWRELLLDEAIKI